MRKLIERQKAEARKKKAAIEENPFVEEDIGKRFELLKRKMAEEESAGVVGKLFVKRG